GVCLCQPWNRGKAIPAAPTRGGQVHAMAAAIMTAPDKAPAGYIAAGRRSKRHTVVDLPRARAGSGTASANCEKREKSYRDRLPARPGGAGAAMPQSLGLMHGALGGPRQAVEDGLTLPTLGL